MKKFFTLQHYAGNGFTLVELVVVIAVLAIMGGFGGWGNCPDLRQKAGVQRK